MFILEKAKKYILNIIFILISINKKVFLKNQVLVSLFCSKKPIIAISYIIKVKPLIF